MELRWTDGNLYRARFISSTTSLIYQVSSLHSSPLADTQPLPAYTVSAHREARAGDSGLTALHRGGGRGGGRSAVLPTKQLEVELPACSCTATPCLKTARCTEPNNRTAAWLCPHLGGGGGQSSTAIPLPGDQAAWGHTAHVWINKVLA